MLSIWAWNFKNFNLGLIVWAVKIMRELLKKQGLLVFGDKCYLNNFIFERPFCIYASVNCQNVRGGGSRI